MKKCVCVVVFVALALWGCGRGSKSAAEDAMKQYAKEMGWTYIGGSCTESDSDEDGYISCTANVKLTSDSPPVTQNLECDNGSILDTTGGCKQKTPGFFGK